MEFKQMTKEQFYAKVHKGYRYGKMQAIVKEVERTGYDYCEIQNPYLTADSFQACFNSAAKKMGAGVRVLLRKGHLFAYKVANDDDNGNAKAGV